ncbi:hypothetical protein QUF76_13705, partial [Desulfobacterales bacterium HSG16]|nr:hypothetical protein [Desulfobacterales bacterium HSG16]
QNSGIIHFKYLKNLQEQVTEKNLDLEAVVAQISKLPALDEVLPFFKTRELEQYHLFDLGSFISENEKLTKLEENNNGPFKLASDNVSHSQNGTAQNGTYSACCAGIFDVFARFVESDFSNLKLLPDEQNLQKKIAAAEAEIAVELDRFEAKIYKLTGLKMIYPYPKEIEPDAANLVKIRECSLVSVTDKQNICFIDYKLPSEILEKVAVKEKLEDSFAGIMKEKLARINQKLEPFFSIFAAYYEKRKDQVYRYALLLIKNRHELTLPEFQDTFGCRIEKALLPCVKQQVADYVPLDIALGRGSNLLFGANMTGKTTVLKTLYFHLTLIRAGLPVPAQSIRLHFPEQADLHLKTSGDLRRNLSGFAEEIQFFCNNQRPYAYILSDELFQSTDPVSGVELSKIFLAEHAEMDGIFFCTSHYPDVLHIKDLMLFRMKDTNGNKKSSVPYAVEKICADRIEEALAQSRRPLEIALEFPLSDSIKEKIRINLLKNVTK